MKSACTKLFHRVTALCLMAVGVWGCTPFTGVATTRITLTEAYVEQTGIAAIVGRVENKARDYGARCAQFEDPNFFLKCRYKQAPLDGEIDVLRANDGSFVLAVGSTATSLTPPSRADILAGTFVSNVHKDFEAWALDTVPQGSIVRAVRRYSELGTLDLRTGVLEVHSR